MDDASGRTLATASTVEKIWNDSIFHTTMWNTFWYTGVTTVFKLALGLWLFLGYGIGRGQGWMHAKLAAVALLVVYHLACGRMLKKFEQGTN
ncbi:MAG: CopD family protein, partial [Pollutimonas bauzanensis]